MKTKLSKYFLSLILLVLILLNIHLIIEHKKIFNKNIVMQKHLNTLSLKNNQLSVELQDQINEKSLNYTLLDSVINFDKINRRKFLVVIIPPNSCTSCVERLFINIGQLPSIRDSVFLIDNNNGSFVNNTWQNQINSNIIDVDYIPDVINSKNKPFLCWGNKNFQQLRFIWDNSLLPEVTDNFILNRF